MEIERRKPEITEGVFPELDSALVCPDRPGDIVAAAAVLAADREYAEDAPGDVEGPLFGTA